MIGMATRKRTAKRGTPKSAKPADGPAGSAGWPKRHLHGASGPAAISEELEYHLRRTARPETISEEPKYHLHRLVPKPIEHSRTYVHHISPMYSRELRLAEGGVMAFLIVLFFAFLLHYFGLSTEYIPIMAISLWIGLVAIFYKILEG
ncbi:MAG: hypothetical protein NT157_04160 [Candidatus Micrarchaeota archaeon]|nr:hypothetical protein [Candidatus Micrarchaeota archaeon]